MTEEFWYWPPEHGPLVTLSETIRITHRILIGDGRVEVEVLDLDTAEGGDVD